MKLIIFFCFCYTISGTLISTPQKNESTIEATSDDIPESVHLSPAVVHEEDDLVKLGSNVMFPIAKHEDDEDYNQDVDPRNSEKVPRVNVSINADDSATDPSIPDIDSCGTILTSDQTITSPKYPEKYPNQYKEAWCFELDGPIIEIHIEKMDLDPTTDYLLIRGGHDNDADESRNLITGNQTDLIIRVVHTNQVYIVFSANQEAANEKFTGFKADVTSYGEHATTTPPPSTTVPIYTGDVQRVTKSIIIPKNIQNDTQIYDKTIRNALITATNKWIEAHGFQGVLEECRHENIIFKHVAQCSITWPDHENCVRIEFAVPINETDHDDPNTAQNVNRTGLNPDYEMTESHIEEMWIEFGINELKKVGLEEYKLPSATSVLLIWTAVCLLVVICFILVLYLIWKVDFLKDYKRMSESHENDESNVKRPIDISMFPAPDQVVPPFLSEQEQFNTSFVDDFGNPDPETTVYDVRNKEPPPVPVKHSVKFAADIVDFNEGPSSLNTNPFAAELETSESLRRDHYFADGFNKDD